MENNSTANMGTEAIHLLRPHHGMCLTYFVGEGYSGDFTRNMACMKDLLEHGASIRLTIGPDEICAACPNRIDDGPCYCSSEEKVLRYDRAVLSALSLTEGTAMSYHQFSGMMYDYILCQGLRENICGDCQWTALCR